MCQLLEKDLYDLKKAKRLLEKKSIVISMTNLFGSMVETIGHLLPVSYRESISKANLCAIEKSWDYTISTMTPAHEPSANEKQHIFWVTVSGAIGGVGILTLFLELPVTTILMLRAVADIARDEGEDFNQFDTKIASLEVFALGGDEIDEHTGETGYYAIRIALQKPLEESSKYIAQKGMTGMGAPFVVQLVAKICAKYQTIIAAKTVSRLIPVIGAATGAYINVVYINYFQDKARGHFIIRRLEKKYGITTIKKNFKAITPEHPQKYYDPKNSLKDNKISPDVEAENILRRHVWGAMGVGLIPVPIMDFTALSLLQLMLLRKLAKNYHVPFSKDIAKSILSSLFSSALSFPAALFLTVGVEKLAFGASIAKLIPGIGATVGVATMPLVSGASTYAIGKVFIQHFSTGGTFLTLDPEMAKNYYRDMYNEGKKVAAEMKISQS